MSISSLRSSGRESQLQRYVSSHAICIDWQVNPDRVTKSTSPFIHILDDDSLLNIFYLCRPSPLKVNENNDISWNWRDERWWYKLAQVCQRWRCLILGSASYLRLCLVCTCGTPVAEMLAHSPPFPLIIQYEIENGGLSTKDEEGIMLALQHRDRVCRVSLSMPAPSLQKVITAINDEFPILEFLSIWNTLLLRSDLRYLQLPSDSPRYHFTGYTHPHILIQIISFKCFHSCLIWGYSI